MGVLHYRLDTLASTHSLLIYHHNVAGRATVEFIVERNGDDSAFVDQKRGGPVRQARLGITLDGYSAPLTAGNMAANVQDGIYNGTKLNASYASVLAGAGKLAGM